MTANPAKTIFEEDLSDNFETEWGLSFEVAEQIFDFFKNCSVFKWTDVNNNCEDRAEAICILLDEWKVPNCKGWVFGGSLIRKETGCLTNNWKYHVAAALPVKINNTVKYYIVDPATSQKLETIADWADSVTGDPYSHHLVKFSNYYIFMPGKINKQDWHIRNRQNYKWTIQGLSGINGLSPVGKAYLCFNKRKIKTTGEVFTALKKSQPPFLAL